MIDIAKIEAARGRIASTVHRTRTELSDRLSTAAGVPVYLKLEHHQRTGSFKIRGATNAILNLTDDQRAKGVVGVSTGNHGRGLAYAARQNGVRCIVAMSKLVPQNKIDGIRAQGAEVRIVGQSQDDAQVEVDRLVEEEGMTMIPPLITPTLLQGRARLAWNSSKMCPT
ncbi:pyridoxal-phosphate dependent enzyme [Roseovarius sp. W115]|uniref:Pyridoxal-phosphate dependent enzyme n=1 Tax=Roseovarius rhodophyticola TaxID=3080827 RepID=A0ABZ2TEW9_9RHOB|nr:pyridoxal-phosphate dependent enzyme [Roseovarius sp. W115]MDV2928446.1 pyridoxal-phosphate dependent enzyme [Roseovarius sp. W115]